MDENKPAAKDDSLLNTIARTMGTTAGIIVSKATQFTEEAAAQAARVSKRAKAPERKAKAPERKAKTPQQRAVAKKKKAVARKRTVKKAAQRATGGRAKRRR
jgi:hypothetical protein